MRKPWHHKISSFLKRHEQNSWTFMLIFLLGFMFFFAYSLLKIKDRFTGLAEAEFANKIISPQHEDPAENNPKTSTSATAAKESSLEDQLDIHWKEKEKIRVAANLLAQSDDLNGAFSLLMQGEESSENIRSIGEAAFANLQFHFDPVVKEELKDLQAFWKALDDDQKASYISGNAAAEIKTLNERLGNTDLQSSNLKEMDSLPLSLKYTLLNNLFIELKRKSKCPDFVIDFLIDRHLPRVDLAKKIYWHKKYPRQIPYGEHVADFNEALNLLYLNNIAHKKFLSDKENYQKSSPEVRKWLEASWGESYCKKLINLDKKSFSHDEIRETWTVFSEHLKFFWAEHLARTLRHRIRTDFSPAVLEQSSYLKYQFKELNKEFVLDRVRNHPNWQKAMRHFDYKQAKETSVKILIDLNCAKYFVKPTGKGSQTIEWYALTAPLSNEAELVRNQAFPWHTCANILNTTRAIPMAVSQEKKDNFINPDRKYGENKWEDIELEKVYYVFRRVILSKPELNKEFSIFLKVFAENRSLISSRED